MILNYVYYILNNTLCPYAFYFIGIQLIHNIVLTSAVKCFCDAYINIFNILFHYDLSFSGASAVVCLQCRRPHVMQETWVQSLGWEDSLEKEMATHSSILAWEILWTEEPGGLQSMGSQQSDMT